MALPTKTKPLGIGLRCAVRQLAAAGSRQVELRRAWHRHQDRRPVVERLPLIRNMPLQEYQLSTKVAKTPVKATVLSSDRVSQRFDWRRSTAVYPDRDAFKADVVEITRQIIRASSRRAAAANFTIETHFVI